MVERAHHRAGHATPLIADASTAGGLINVRETVRGWAAGVQAIRSRTRSAEEGATRPTGVVSQPDAVSAWGGGGSAPQRGFLIIAPCAHGVGLDDPIARARRSQATSSS